MTTSTAAGLTSNQLEVTITTSLTTTTSFHVVRSILSQSNHHQFYTNLFLNNSQDVHQDGCCLAPGPRSLHHQVTSSNPGHLFS